MLIESLVWWKVILLLILKLCLTFKFSPELIWTWCRLAWIITSVVTVFLTTNQQFVFHFSLLIHHSYLTSDLNGNNVLFTASVRKLISYIFIFMILFYLITYILSALIILVDFNWAQNLTDSLLLIHVIRDTICYLGSRFWPFLSQESLYISRYINRSSSPC